MEIFTFWNAEVTLLRKAQRLLGLVLVLFLISCGNRTMLVKVSTTEDSNSGYPTRIYWIFTNDPNKYTELGNEEVENLDDQYGKETYTKIPCINHEEGKDNPKGQTSPSTEKFFEMAASPSVSVAKLEAATSSNYYCRFLLPKDFVYGYLCVKMGASLPKEMAMRCIEPAASCLDITIKKDSITAFSRSEGFFSDWGE